jgi:hypothetical protein
MVEEEGDRWGVPPSGSSLSDWILPQKEKKSVTCFSVTWANEPYSQSIWKHTFLAEIGCGNSRHGEGRGLLRAV